MRDGTGLRERKKQQTRRVISEAAIAMFLERGFDQVSVTDVAAAADVSKMTVFNYFPTKEDLVLHRFEDHFDDVVAIVLNRKPGESALGALRRHFLAGLDRHDVTSGLNDDEQVLAFQRMVMSAPSLRFRVMEQAARTVDALAAVLAEQTGAELGDITPRVAASQLCSIRIELVRENVRRLVAGEKADYVHADAVTAAQRAFALLEDGLGDYCV
ncbi:TetR/AcrR family transcriptional regulator [Actinoallomurus purpureus]|uniref:TetR/AcrR family transcriptional regulator n=1 Tax=Actinoallomurus purpureus TaxID=478114 RepID=UPI00209294B0|nr:TetR family transcriptional regulator [Actinoallomurus purpureus]MCO6006871.1 TetR/AcrR family transcriptional regulator [Actinoallomurus purpureus]